MAYDYQRRQALARDKGFASYGEYRRATEYANASRDFHRLTRNDVTNTGRWDREALDNAKLYYQAFKQGDPSDYSLRTRNGRPVVRIGPDGKPQGAKAKWLIDVAHYVDDAGEWRRRYPRGRREF